MVKYIDENYSVDSGGNIYSRPRTGTKGGKLTPTLGSTGYMTVTLSPSRRPVKVHRLVAEAFIPNPMLLPQVNHKDGNKINNASSNLEWCTCAENAAHANELGLITRLCGENQKGSKLTEADIVTIRTRYKPNSRIDGARALSREYKVAKSTILRIARREDWKHLV